MLNSMKETAQLEVLTAVVRLHRVGITDIFKIAYLAGYPSHRFDAFRLAVSHLIDRGLVRYGSASPRTLELTAPKFLEQEEMGILENRSNSQVQQELFLLVTHNNRKANPDKLVEFWKYLTNGRSHKVLDLTGKVLGDPSKRENMDHDTFRGFQQMVQQMINLDVVTWTKTQATVKTKSGYETLQDGLLRLNDIAFPNGRP